MCRVYDTIRYDAIRVCGLYGAVGAGFYLNATNPKYEKHYNMLTHVTKELPEVIQQAGLPIVSNLPSFRRSAVSLNILSSLPSIP